ncbi:MAG: PfkB family carbohydrate kinase, partial [Paracoccaceae bacterium]
IITLGADGYIAQAPDGTRFGAKAHRVPVISTHGAGDAFVGALAAEIARGTDLAEAAAFAQGAAALHVSTPIEARPNITPVQLRHAFGL